MSIVGLDSSLFASGDTSAAYLIWQYMQGFANVVIVFVLLAVIISQVTGFGIDNYGIKKILPKLIVMAILINLSFIICQLAVDLSNIAGLSISRLFTNMGNNVLATLKANGVVNAADIAEFGFSALFTGLFGAATGVAVALPIAIEAIALGATFWWIPLLFAAIIGLISVIIFFLLLAARKLLAVVLVAISPLALVCYVLPNTRKLFDKWVEAFKAVLIVYPVCGALYGISKLMKVIAFTADGIHIGMMIVALLSTFVPFFIAPSLIKKALNAVGEVGGLISRMGDRIKGGVRGANDLVKQSAVYKDAQRSASMRRAGRSNEKFEAARRRVAELTEKDRSKLSMKEKRELARAQRRTSSQFRQRQFAMNAQALDRGAAEDVETTRIMMREGTGNYDTNIMGTQLNEMLDRVDRGETLSRTDQNMVYALASQLSQQSGGAKKIYEAIRGRVGASAQMMGRYMAQNDKVRAAAENKGRRVSARINDIASGAVAADTTQEQYDAMNNQYLSYRRQQRALGADIMSEEDWRRNETNNGRTVDETTAIQSIARDVLDKDHDLVTQSGAEVEALIGALRTTAGGQERIDRMAQDANLFGRGDVAEGVRQTILRNATRPQEPVAPTAGSQPTAGDQQVAGDGHVAEGEVFDVRGMSDETLLDMATNPNVDMNNKIRTAAEAEYLRRNPGGNH